MTFVDKRTRQCDAKQGYPTRGAAVLAMDRHHGFNNPDFNVYECPHCFMWHVGHNSLLGSSA